MESILDLSKLILFMMNRLGLGYQALECKNWLVVEILLWS